MAAAPGSRVVIVGGGFAGLFAARTLRRAPAQVTLIDRAEATGIDPGRRQVVATRPGGEMIPGGETIEFGYDHLIVAAGVEQPRRKRRAAGRAVLAPGSRRGAEGDAGRRFAARRRHLGTCPMDRTRWAGPGRADPGMRGRDRGPNGPAVGERGGHANRPSTQSRCGGA